MTSATKPKAGSTRKGCLPQPTPPAWDVVDWTELLPPKDAPECEDTERDVFLWWLLRRVRDWARGNDLAFNARDPRLGAKEPSEYRRAANTVATLDVLLPDLSTLTSRTDRLQVLRASLGVSGWAESVGKPLLALRFAEAAAACDPFDPAPANTAARISRV